ncbi:ABC transporter substrate-binding protein [Puniceibacterium confluentis]|uniref:ABC transporter substrate-binding protein n=1 Tax=Puniceibacterium confluentis TaxID=1958944 RepID=UPI0011B7FCBF|nr:ABC transporter substrate-binding protein [Puniceibacterium confluentis]
MRTVFGPGILAGILLATSAIVASAQSITVVLPEEPPSLEPCESKHSSVGRVIIRNVTQSLTVIEPTSGALEPLLATSWEQLDELTWRFKLREGVTFSDGADFDAAAVATAIERLQREDIVCNTKQQTLGGVELTATPVDALTLDITTSEPVPILPTMMSVVQVSAPSMPIEGASRQPVGTGPYTLTSWKAGESISLALRGDYWGDKPEVSDATFVWRSESAVRAAMVEKGEADIALVIAGVDADDPQMDFAYPNGETTRMRISTKVPPLDDVRVRRAMNLALDLEAMKPIIGSEAQLASQLVGPAVNGFDADLKPFGYDPEEAAALVKAAQADGMPVDQTITIIGREGIYPGSTEILEAMQALWSEIGLTTEIRTFDTGNWLRYQNRPFPEPDMPNVHTDQHDNLLGDATFTLFNKYHSDGVNSTLHDAEVDALIEKGEPATGAARTEAFQAAFARIHDDLVADVFMYHMVGYTRVSPRVIWKPSVSTNSELDLSQVRMAD